MNYARDRLDRRARHRNGGQHSAGDDVSFSLYGDYRRGLRGLASWEGHELLARTLRDAGKCRQALYHYGMAWGMMEASVSSSDGGLGDRAGDYAQMAEFAGFPDVGMLSLMHYRARGSWGIAPAPDETLSDSVAPRDASWLRTRISAAARSKHCGCGSRDCGTKACFIPMPPEELASSSLLAALEAYIVACCNAKEREMPSAYSVLSYLGRPDLGRSAKEISIVPIDVPSALQIWNDNDPHYRPLNPVLQLLATKLLYGTIPSLAALSVIHLSRKHRLDPALNRDLARDFKSHNAYHVLMEAVVLGERIKPHRRALLPVNHIPVWDIMWDRDGRHTRNEQPFDKDHDTIVDTTGAKSWVARLRHRLMLCTRSSDDMIPHPPLPVVPPKGAPRKPLYVVGDSHVLSIAWQTLRITTWSEQSCTATTTTALTTATTSERLLVPWVVTGLKAWHTRQGTAFFTHSLLHTLLSRQRPWTCKVPRTILFSAGEIDCREGMGGPLLEGYPTDPCSFRPHIEETATQYVEALIQLAREYQLTILVMPVAPHAYRAPGNGRKVGRVFRRVVMLEWNEAMRQALSATTRNSENQSAGPCESESPVAHTGKHNQQSVFWLDYASKLRHDRHGSGGSDEYVLDSKYNADYTHMNSAFLPHLEQAIVECGCDLERL